MLCIYNNCVLEGFLQLVTSFFQKNNFKLLLLIWKVEGRNNFLGGLVFVYCNLLFLKNISLYFLFWMCLLFPFYKKEKLKQVRESSHFSQESLFTTVHSCDGTRRCFWSVIHNVAVFPSHRVHLVGSTQTLWKDRHIKMHRLSGMGIRFSVHIRVP